MRRLSLVAVTFVVSLFVATSGARAVVVNMSGAGRFGAALMPGTPRPAASRSSPRAHRARIRGLPPICICPPMDCVLTAAR